MIERDLASQWISLLKEKDIEWSGRFERRLSSVMMKVKRTSESVMGNIMDVIIRA